MKRIVNLGIGAGDLWLAVRGQALPGGARTMDGPHGKFWLRQAVPPNASPSLLHALTDIAEALGYSFHGALGYDELPFVLDYLSQALLDGRLVAFRAASLEGGGKGPQPDPEPPKPEPKKNSWIKIKFLDDLAGAPVAGVTATLTLSDGSTGDSTTRNDGLIEANGIPSGTCDVKGNLQGAKLATTLTFMGTGDSPGGQKSPDDEPIAAGSYIVATIEAYKVKKGDTLDSIAGDHGLSAQDLAIFNFGTSDAAAVNHAIRARVGSKTLGTDKKTYVFDDKDSPGLIYIPKEWKQDGLATEKTHPLRVRPVVPRWLTILKVDDHFAPSKEDLDIKYSIGGLSKKKVYLEIKSDHYKGGPIFKRELTADEKKDGEHTLHWDGKANTTSGDLKDHYINPLYGPYKVHIYVDTTYTDEAKFKVLYHSIKIRKGPWTVDEAEPPEANEKEWVRYKLNELGYWGGPVDQDYTTPGDANSYLKKAIIRYKANHKKLHQLDYTKYDDSITADLKAALKAGDNRRPGFLEEGAFTNTGTESKIKVEAITYEDGEFGTPKPPYEKDRLNRPLVPVEVDIYLKNKHDAETLAPEAVGACRINWRNTDGDEDLSSQHTTVGTEPSKTKDYIEKCLKLKSGRAGHGDNAHKDFGGIRDDAKDYVTPFAMGTQYTPYESKEDGGQKVVYTKACVDKAKYPKRLGKAGIFFQPSRVSGDDYKLTAEIDFADLPNKADLEKFHKYKDKDLKSRIHVTTGTFRIWRFNQIAMVVNWPARTNGEDWGLIHDEFLKAWLDVDTGHITYKTITDVITEAEYRAIVEAHTSHKQGIFKKIRLKPNSLVGVSLPSQGWGTDDATYKAALKTFTNDDYWDKIYDPLRAQLSKNIRKEHPAGFIVVNFMTHEPVDIMEKPPFKRTVTFPNYITWTFSIGLPDSVIFADQKDPDKVYYVVSHEMGHNFWLQHWENAGPVFADHDNNDHNCSMAYSGSLYPHQAPGSYTPHFCGKCNLKLRGWDVNAGGIPASS
jgi:LysM repeat protein